MAKRGIIILILFFTFFNLAGQVVLDPANGIKILAIGNSYSQNSMHYIPILLKQLGVNESRIKVVNAYIGGGSLQNHANFARSYTPVDVQVFGAVGMPWFRAHLEQIIRQDQWDVITLQQNSDNSLNSSTYNESLDYLVNLVTTLAPNAKLGWHMTWAWANNRNGVNQNYMYTSICNAVKEKIVPNNKIKFIIPTGTAIQNARNYYFGDNLTNDGTHLNDRGCYVAAAMWVKTITGYDISRLTMPEKEQIVQAVNAAHAFPFNTSLEIPTYTVTFNPNGGSVSPASGATGSNRRLSSLPTPTRTGYNFVGWFTQTNGGTQVTTSWEYGANATIYARWTPITYTIKYDLDGGVASPDNPENYTAATPSFALNNPTKTGHTFTGWTGTNGEIPQTTVTITQGSTGDRTYTAHWEKIIYTVSFMVDDEIYHEQSVTHGDTFEAPQVNPEKEGYTFLYWFLDDENEAFDFATELKENIALTAKWEKIMLTVVFMVDGEAYHESLVAYGDVADAPQAPDKEGYIFVGWFLDDDDEVFDFATEIKENIALIAKWERIMLRVLFMLDDEDYDVQIVAYGDTADEPQEPVKEGYIFIGWFEDEIIFDFDTPITKDHILYADWEIIEIATYTVTFIDGTNVEEVEVDEGEMVTEPEDPIRDGFSFEGWFEEGATEKFDFDTPITADITLNAKWATTTITNSDDIFAPELKIYPNPFVGELRILGAEGCTLQVISANGTIMHTQRIENEHQTIHLEHLPKGIYFFRLQKDEQMKTIKMVKD